MEDFHDECNGTSHLQPAFSSLGSADSWVDSHRKAVDNLSVVHQQMLHSSCSCSCDGTKHFSGLVALQGGPSIAIPTVLKQGVQAVKQVLRSKSNSPAGAGCAPQPPGLSWALDLDLRISGLPHCKGSGSSWRLLLPPALQPLSLGGPVGPGCACAGSAALPLQRPARAEAI